MGDGKVEKGEMHDFARKVGEGMGELDRRLHSLALAFDCLATVLEKLLLRRPDHMGTFGVDVAGAIKAELERRKKVAEAPVKTEET